MRRPAWGRKRPILLQGLPPRVKFGVRFFGPRACAVPTVSAVQLTELS